MIQSLILSFLLGGIIVLTFALVDEKIYQEHQFAFIFLLSTFVLLFESLLVFLDVTLFSNIRLSDLNMLLWPVYLYPYYHYANRTNRLCAIFYSFFTYLAVEGTATFLTIIVSSVLGDAVVAAYSIVYNMCIRLLSLGIILKLIDLFEFDFTPFYEKEFEKYLMKKDGLDPFNWDFRQALSTNFRWAKPIALFYGLQPVQIHQSIKGFLWFSRLFFTTSKAKRHAIFAGMRIARVYGEIHGFFANEKDNPRCRYSNEKLELLMKKSVQDAIKMTEELEKAYRGEMRLGKIFDQTFSGKEEA